MNHHGIGRMIDADHLVIGTLVGNVADRNEYIGSDVHVVSTIDEREGSGSAWVQLSVRGHL